MTTGPRNKCGIKGFTLLEMAIVLVIVAIVAGGGAVWFSADLARAQQRDTVAKLETLQKTLLDYRRAFNRLPCPADVTLALTNNSFGVEGANAGTCTGGAPAANFTSGNIVLGMIPTKALKLPDEYAFDIWGGRIMYAVDNRLTGQDAFNSVAITDTTARITVRRDAAGTVTTDQAIYVLVSHGANKHGAYPRGGGTARNAVGNVPDEFLNCDCNATGTSTGFDANFLQKLPSQNATDLNDAFDDIVRYATRPDLKLVAE